MVGSPDEEPLSAPIRQIRGVWLCRTFEKLNRRGLVSQPLGQPDTPVTSGETRLDREMTCDDARLKAVSTYHFLRLERFN